jgi:hypothetical protein
MRTALTILLFAVSAFAQNSPALGAHAACGPLGVRFRTPTSASQPQSKAESEALVCVVQDCREAPGTIGAPTIKVGADGHW